MAGQFEADLCSIIIEEKFGKSVGLVMYTLLREPSNLSLLLYNLKGQLSPLTVKKALAVLDQFNILRFKQDPNMRISYAIDPEAVTALLKAPRCGLVIQKLYGNQGPATDMLLRAFYSGRLSCSDIIRKVQAIGESMEVQTLKDIFCKLVESQFLIRCPMLEHKLHGCPHFQANGNLSAPPDKIATDLSANEQRSSNKRKHPEDDPDAEILWRVNFNRFDRYFRDELIQELVVPKNWTDEKSSKICKNTLQALLKTNETRCERLESKSSSPISVYDIAKTSKDLDIGVDKTDIDWALRILVEDARGVIRKAGDSGGGLYVIDFERAISLSCQHHLECLIREQLDTKAVRVFRLLQSKGYMEEEQIEKLTMMSAKETRELLFAMQEEGYVFTKPIGKTQDFAPARTFYLYYVDLTKIVRGLLEYTCKSLRNLILRRKKEVEDCKWLIDKNAKMEYIIDEIRGDPEKDEETKEAEIADVKETYMPSSDMTKYEKFVKAKTLLDQAEVETERVLLTLRLHLLMAKVTTPA